MPKFTGPSVIYSDYQSLVLPSHMNYGRFVLDRILNNKEKVALINGETHEKITYNELAQLIVNTATSFKKLGVKKNDMIGICSENRNEFLVTAIAGWAIGATVTFINSAYSKDELVHTTNISKPKFMFLSPKTFKVYYETIKNLDFVKQVFVYGSEVPDPAVVSFETLSSPNVDIGSFKTDNLNGSGQTALVLYSSGTTGLPKGAKLSHQNLITAGLQPVNTSLGFVSLSVAPWSNTVGIILTMNLVVYGQTIVYLTRFIENTYLACIEKYKVQLLMAVPPLLVLLNQSKILKKYNLTSVELVYCGGAPLDEGVINEAKKTFPKLRHVLQGYGMTETSGGLTEEFENKPRQGSVGTIIKGNILKIVDVDSRKMLGPNQTGEVCVKGPVLFQGYIGKDLKDDLDEEGFYKTGDIAYYDEDGYFYIVDRLKELIKYKAGQVAPSELEALLRQHPAVQDVGVTGIPDPLVGELPTAFIVKNPKVEVTEVELKDYVASKVAVGSPLLDIGLPFRSPIRPVGSGLHPVRYCGPNEIVCPPCGRTSYAAILTKEKKKTHGWTVSSWKQLRGGVIFVQEIPKTPSGKILRRKLREMLTKPASKL